VTAVEAVEVATPTTALSLIICETGFLGILMKLSYEFEYENINKKINCSKFGQVFSIISDTLIKLTK
jgi:hypothetical protein